MQNAVLIEVQAAHECWCIELSEKFKDATLTGIPTHAEQPNSIAHMFIVKNSEIQKVIEFIKKHPMTTIVKVMKKSKDNAIIYVEQPKNSLFVTTATNYGGIMTEPSLTKEGKDYVSLFFSNEKNIKPLFSQLSPNYEVKLLSKKIIPINEFLLDTFQTSGFFKLQTTSRLLSERQKEIFGLACRRGYFKIPKKVTIEELAQELGLDARTAADHLRKAQSKLSPFIADVMKLF